MKDLPPWDDDVLALLNSERRASSLSDERREQLLERVERSAAVMGAIAGLGGAGLVAGAALSKASWIERLTVTASGAKAAVAVAFVSGVVGGGIVTATALRLVQPSENQTSSPPPSAVSNTPRDVPPAASSIDLSPETPPTSDAPAAPLASDVPNASLSPTGRLDAERTWLERARSALSRGDAEGALRALHQHQRRFPRGELVEERDVLMIRALVAGGRKEEARVKFESFKVRTPNSVFLPSLEKVTAP